MKLVRDHKPLHELYAPGARKQFFPQADYRFLVRAAANLARAVASVHASGCVIGDINHSGALFSAKATASLIDADSFQFSLGSRVFFCKVGVPEYTPPELQSQPLGSIVRTANHDCFGLAVIIFQLLFMGRHPFVGTVRRGDIPPLHEAIRDYRFVYTDGRNVGMDQPPGTPAVSDFPLDVGKYFEAAFGRQSRDQRPMASDWIKVLDRRREVDRYGSQRREKQLQAFLQNFQIQTARIRGIGTGKQAALASYGIDTAADISTPKVLTVPGIGPAIAEDLVKWRSSCEGRFRYSDAPNQAAAQELSRISLKYISRAAELRRTLVAGAANLSSLSQRIKTASTIGDPLVSKTSGEQEALRQKIKDLGGAVSPTSFEWPTPRRPAPPSIIPSSPPPTAISGALAWNAAAGRLDGQCSDLPAVQQHYGQAHGAPRSEPGGQFLGVLSLSCLQRNPQYLVGCLQAHGESIFLISTIAPSVIQQLRFHRVRTEVDLLLWITPS